MFRINGFCRGLQLCTAAVLQTRSREEKPRFFSPFFVYNYYVIILDINTITIPTIYVVSRPDSVIDRYITAVRHRLITELKITVFSIEFLPLICIR